MSCKECGSESSLHVMKVLDLSERKPEWLSITRCLKCLRQKEFYCDIHKKVHLAIYDPDAVDVKEGQYILLSACLDCCFEEALALSETDAKNYHQILSQFASERCLMEMGTLATLYSGGQLSQTRLYVFGAILSSKLFLRELPQAVTDLVVGDKSRRQ